MAILRLQTGGTLVKIIKPSPDPITQRVAGVGALTKKSLRSAMFSISRDLKKTAADGILEKPKHGNLYLVELKGRLVKHRASAPHEDPAELTGALRRSLKTNIIGSNELEFGAGNEAHAPYARALELGALIRLRTGVTIRIEPREFLKRSIRKNNRNIVATINKKLQEQLKG